MIRLEFPSALPGDKFMTPFGGWYAGEQAAEVIKLRVNNTTCDCRLESRPDVKAAYAGKKCVGFRGTLDFVGLIVEPQASGGMIKVEVVVEDIEAQVFSIAIASTWLEDLHRMRAAGSVGANELGLGLASGDGHYRAYVGRPEDYDLSAAGAFQLLVLLGMRQYHRVLDIGCGSLRSGRLIIPYLNAGNYLGMEPNRWLVDQGIASELGRDILAVKRPAFLYTDSPAALQGAPCANFALANSIFSHASLPQIDGWLRHTAGNLCHSGALVATFLEGAEDYAGHEWVYPGCVSYRRATIEALAGKYGFRFRMLDWRHLHGQKWAVFARPAYRIDFLEQGTLTWNSVMATLGD